MRYTHQADLFAAPRPLPLELREVSRLIQDRGEDLRIASREHGGLSLHQVEGILDLDAADRPVLRQALKLQGFRCEWTRAGRRWFFVGACDA